MKKLFLFLLLAVAHQKNSAETIQTLRFIKNKADTQTSQKIINEIERINADFKIVAKSIKQLHLFILDQMFDTNIEKITKFINETHAFGTQNNIEDKYLLQILQDRIEKEIIDYQKNLEICAYNYKKHPFNSKKFAAKYGPFITVAAIATACTALSIYYSHSVKKHNALIKDLKNELEQYDYTIRPFYPTDPLSQITQTYVNVGYKSLSQLRIAKTEAESTRNALIFGSLVTWLITYIQLGTFSVPYKKRLEKLLTIKNTIDAALNDQPKKPDGTFIITQHDQLI